MEAKLELQEESPSKYDSPSERGEGFLLGHHLPELTAPQEETQLHGRHGRDGNQLHTALLSQQRSEATRQLAEHLKKKRVFSHI